ncbi:carboxylic ester hydrolase [Muriicola marianensis]|uniref:Carboxylic ester hydrolase n=2 Tax=Muriicola marianensis TaxID=1324801 RepID=A0ABQ1QTJ6_9FLAO|nr:carboxylic ester hydrolase [Muriicola marianensis]
MTVLSLNAQTDSVRLIEPRGPYPVGTVTYEWQDRVRLAEYSAFPEDKRMVVAQLWYPASPAPGDHKAVYNPISEDYRKVIGNSYLRAGFHPSVKNANLILIAPGRGTERFLYTTLAEDLASYGFVVVSVDMPSIGYTIFGDGMIVKPDPSFRPPPGMMGGPYEKVDQFFERPTALGAADLELVYQKLTELNRADPDQRFTNRLNLESVGIFGHSLGGRIAGQFAANHSFVTAYAAMEGIPPRDVRYEGKIEIPTLMICSKGTLPYAIENYNSYLDNSPVATYFAVLEDFGHNTLTDNPFIYPDRFNYAIDPEEGLKISRKLLSAYFFMQLMGRGDLQKDLNDIEQLNISIHGKY